MFCLCASGTNLLSGHHKLVKSWSPEKSVEAAWRLSLPVSGDVTCICTSPANHELFAVSVDTSVLLYDQRSPGSPLHHFTCNREEINEICINRRGQYLSACDDSGAIQVMDIQTGKLHRSCRRHDNLCSSIVYHPRKSWELISGGLDCYIRRWDFSRGKQLATLNTQEYVSNSRGAYMINPPMIHCLASVEQDPLIIAGLGNGALAVTGIGQRDQLDVLALTSIHSSAINAVQCFKTTVLQDGLLTNSSPSLTDSEAGHSSSEGSDSKFEGATASVTDTTSNKDVTKYTIISGGNDCKICLSTLTCTSTKKSSKSSLKSKKQGQKPSVAYSYNLPSGSVVSFDHGSKINWISLLYESIDHTTSPLVCVADQGPSITIYKVAHP